MIINRSITLNCSDINENIINNIVDLAKQKFERVAYKDIGIIKSVNEVRIISNTISKSSGLVVLSLSLTVDVIKPDIGDIFDMKVLKITTNKGIFVDNTYFKVIISPDKTGPYKLVESKGGFYNKNVELKIDDIIRVKITTMKYIDKIFRFVGEIV